MARYRWNGRALARLMRSRRLTPTSLSRAMAEGGAAVSRQRIEFWLSGTEPTADGLALLCDFFGVPITAFFRTGRLPHFPRVEKAEAR